MAGAMGARTHTRPEPRGMGRWTPGKAEIARRHKAGEKPSEIARSLGVSRSAVVLALEQIRDRETFERGKGARS